MINPITGAPTDVVEIHAQAPVTSEFHRLARLWAEGALQIGHEADELFGQWEIDEKHQWIREQLRALGKTIAKQFPLPAEEVSS